MAFSCGVPPLDTYLKQLARQERDRRVTQCYVLTPEDSRTIVGYYTLSALSIQPDSFPPEFTKRYPRYETLPAVLLGRLAVDQRYQGRRLGNALLYDATEKAVDSTARVGAVALVVDAKDDRARSFYERFGFRRFSDREMRLFLSLDDAARFVKDERSR